MRMLKGVLFLAMTLATQALHAETLTLVRSNKLGANLVDQIKSEKTGYRLNGTLLAKSQNNNAQRYIALLKKLRSSSKICGAGNFIIVIEDGQLKKEIPGCAEGPEYGKIVAELYKLK